jgi:hypothetical protein
MVILALGTAGCVNYYSGSPLVMGSGRVTTENRTVSGFDQVSVGGSGKLTITQGDEESLTIRADDDLLPLIESKVSHGDLQIGPDNVNLHPTATILYQLKVKNLRAVHLSGSLEADADQIKTDRFSIQVSGSGKVQLGKLEAKRLDIQVSGSGDIQIAGQVEEQRVGISGSADYRAADLASDRVEAGVSGSGSLVVWARNTLTANVSGSGEISYYGTPSLDSQTSGSGHVKSLGSK